MQRLKIKQEYFLRKNSMFREHYNKYYMKEIDFILTHFEVPLFPRKMMTSISNGQFTVTSNEEILQRCKEADYIDCRINAYPEYTQYKGNIRQPPNFVFIDLDLSNFSKYKNPKKMLDRTLENTLKKYNPLAP